MHTTSSPTFTINGLSVSLDQVAAFAPIVSLHPADRFLPCSIESLLVGAILRDNRTGQVVKSNPQPDDLYAHASDDYRIEIAPARFRGDPLAANGTIAAPMYVSVQVPADHSFVDLNFQFLHSYNGAQCVRARRPGQDFNCVVETFAEHQGDIEGLSVRVDPAFERVSFVRFEAHGDSSYFRPDQVDFEGTHPLVSCALHSHASYNGRGRHPTGDDWFALEDFSVLGFGATFIDVVRRDGIPWRPFATDATGRTVAGGRLRFIGLDGHGEPLGTERWAKFRGRLGAHEREAYTGQTGIGRALTPEQSSFVETLTTLVVNFKIIPEDKWWGDGPGGFGGRDLIRTESPMWKFAGT